MAAINGSINYADYAVVAEDDVTLHSGAPRVMPVPQVRAQPFEVQKLQKKVKCWSKCMVIWAYILIIAGAINVVSNLVFILFVDSYSTYVWVGLDGMT